MMNSIGDIPEALREKIAKKDKIDTTPRATPVTLRNKIGRNQPCPCKSGKKYKKCCLLKREYSVGG